MTVALKDRINYGIAFTGWLAHDNKYFDRTCTACGGMYSSFIQTNGLCPKCGQKLSFITFKDENGNTKALSISEGTMYPALSKNQLEKDAQAIKARKRAIPITYRFKIFGFSDEKGILAPPAIHKRLRSGALVEVRMYNHQLLATPFVSKKEGPKVELMLQVFEKYGDKVAVLNDAKTADTVTPHRVMADGAPAPIDMGQTNLQKEMADLQAKLASLTEAVSKMGTTTAPQPQAQAATIPVEAALEDNDCPFTDEELDEEAGQLFMEGASVDPFDVK